MIETLQTPANLTHIVYQHLWHEIASLHLMPGEKLSEVKLAKEFSCSRIPVSYTHLDVYKRQPDGPAPWKPCPPRFRGLQRPSPHPP